MELYVYVKMKTDKLITIWMIDDNEHNKENESISSLLDS